MTSIIDQSMKNVKVRTIVNDLWLNEREPYFGSELVAVPRPVHAGRGKSRFAAFARGDTNGSAAPLPRRRLLGADKGAESARTLRADVLWQRGRRGEGVRIAVFDTGLGRTTSQSNWTDEDTQENVTQMSNPATAPSASSLAAASSARGVPTLNASSTTRVRARFTSESAREGGRHRAVRINGARSLPREGSARV